MHPREHQLNYADHHPPGEASLPTVFCEIHSVTFFQSTAWKEEWTWHCSIETWQTLPQPTGDHGQLEFSWHTNSGCHALKMIFYLIHLSTNPYSQGKHQKQTNAKKETAYNFPGEWSVLKTAKVIKNKKTQKLSRLWDV